MCVLGLAAVVPAASLSIVLDFANAPADSSVAEMKREFEAILKPKG